MEDNNELITLHISLIQENGRLIDVQVPSNCSVGELKRTIESTCSIEADMQLLVYLGRVLGDNNRSIRDYNIVNGATIQLNIYRAYRRASDPSFSYAVERKLLQRKLQHVRDNYASEYFGWQTFLSLQGARLPEGGDSLEYPVGTSLEFLRQGLLTYNTYVSTLTLPASCTPAFAPTQAESTSGPGRIRRFYVGQWIDALDTVNKWLEATVIAVRSDFLYVHYNGWDTRWDEWIHANSRRIAPFRTKTRYLSLRSTLTPDVICWSRDARVTGTEDALTLVKRIDDASSSVWNIIRSLHREEGESEEAWKSRKAAVFQQLAPLIDRVGRLTADAAGVLKCIAEGGEIPAVPPEDEELENPVVNLPPIPREPSVTLDPRYGMDNLVNGAMSENESILPIRSTGNIREITIPLTESSLPQNQQIQSFIRMLQQILDPQVSSAPSREEVRPPLSQVLSNSVVPATVNKPSLINRLRDIGVLDGDPSLSVNRDHSHEVD